MGVKTTEFLIIGAGIIGLSVARELRRRLPKAKITVVEKEKRPGLHASGRNSGVLHAGIYYDPTSLRTRFCRDGARLTKEFCHEHGIPVFTNGKVIVPTGAAGLEDLQRLQRRATENGVRVELIDRKQLLEIEPKCVPVESALYSPDTAAVEPSLVLAALETELMTSDVDIAYDCAVFDFELVRKVAKCTKWDIAYKNVINCAGSGCLVISKKFGIGGDLMLLPFRGSYYEIVSEVRTVRGNIYPVPDARFPFLGVHLSRVASGRVFAGPSAWPVLGPEHYSGLKGIAPKLAAQSLGVLMSEYWSNRGGMRTLVHRELSTSFKANYIKAIRQLLPGISKNEVKPSTKRGIRAQLYSLKGQKLIHDFLVEQTEDSLHVLNAVSPGFTCAPSFAKYLADLATNAKTTRLS